LSHDAQRWADLFGSQFSVLRKTVELTSRRTVGINAALDLGDAFVVAVNHRCDGDRAPYEDGNDRDQKRAQAYDGIEHSIHPPPPALAKFSGGADRDRTGGLLVANQALSQLSYSPIPQWSSDQRPVVRKFN
jgi:hypothetical protein